MLRAGSSITCSSNVSSTAPSCRLGPKPGFAYQDLAVHGEGAEAEGWVFREQRRGASFQRVELGERVGGGAARVQLGAGERAGVVVVLGADAA